MDTQSVAEAMERDISRLKAARPLLKSRIERAEHILVTQLSTSNGSRPVKVRVHADGSRSYSVRSGSKLARSYAVSPATWGCECPDHRKRNSAACKHALACWVLERAYRPSPAPASPGEELEHVSQVAGQVLADAVAERSEPHGCYRGVVFVGHLVEEDGEEVEVFEAVPLPALRQVAGLVP